MTTKVVYCNGCNQEIEPVGPADEISEYYKTADGKFHPKIDCDEAETT